MEGSRQLSVVRWSLALGLRTYAEVGAEFITECHRRKSKTKDQRTADN